MRAGAFFLYYHHPPYYFFRTIAPCVFALSLLALSPLCVFEPSPLCGSSLRPFVVFGLARSVLPWFDVLGKPSSFSIYSSLGIAVPCEFFLFGLFFVVRYLSLSCMEGFHILYPACCTISLHRSMNSSSVR